MQRLHNMPNTRLAKRVFNALHDLHNIGLSTWISKVIKFTTQLNIEFFPGNLNFKTYCKRIVQANFIRNWEEKQNNFDDHSKLKTYSLIKRNYGFENYLDVVKQCKYRNAITRLRVSAHALEIEAGRHSNPPIPRNERVCKTCRVLDDEKHFLMECSLNQLERRNLFLKYNELYRDFNLMPTNEKFKLLFSVKDSSLLTYLGKFIYSSNERRNRKC